MTGNCLGGYFLIPSPTGWCGQSLENWKMLTNVWVACGGGRSKNNNNYFISIAPLKIAFTKCLQTEKAGYPEGSIAESQRVGWGKKESLIKVKTVGAKYTKNYDNFKQIRIKTTNE